MNYGVADNCWTVFDVAIWIAFKVEPEQFKPAAIPEPGYSRPTADYVLGQQQQIALDRALDKINLAVQNGQIEAYGRKRCPKQHREAHRAREVIPATFPDDLRKIDFSGECRIRNDAPDFEWLHDPEPYYYVIQFQIVAVKKLWRRGVSTKANFPSSAALREWWKGYLQNHPNQDQRPNTRQQRADAHAYFTAKGNKGPTETAMQGLRANLTLTPPEWQEPGRRPKSS